MSNVVTLQRKQTLLEKCVGEVSEANPEHWVIISYDPANDRVMVMGPPRIDPIVTLGMLEYAKRCVEETQG